MSKWKFNQLNVSCNQFWCENYSFTSGYTFAILFCQPDLSTVQRFLKRQQLRKILWIRHLLKRKSVISYQIITAIMVQNLVNFHLQDILLVILGSFSYQLNIVHKKVRRNRSSVAKVVRFWFASLGRKLLRRNFSNKIVCEDGRIIKWTHSIFNKRYNKVAEDWTF